jgi:hypothetical protein
MYVSQEEELDIVYQRYATVAKTSRKRLNTSIMKRQIDYMVSRMLGSNRGRVWEVSAKYPTEPIMGPEGLVYTATLTVKRIGRDAPGATLDAQYSHIMQLGNTAGNSSGWEMQSNQPVADDGPNQVEDTPATPDAPPPPQPNFAQTIEVEGIQRNGHFDHIYERESQISVIESSLMAFATSHLHNRFHCCLWGEPACGKTEILRSFSKMLGPEMVLELDATSTTKAGAERILLESEILPPVLLVEEIEKTDDASLRWLLGVLDHRGEIRKTTHTRGMRQRSIKMLCLATVNDMPLFKRVMDGALASRFSQKVYCPRPSKQVLRLILEREVLRVDGDPDWIQPAIDWCVDMEGTNDPRRVTTVCLSGQDKLLTGEYQEWLGEVCGPGEKR